jgi:Flp pilus assembly protein TadB
MGINSVGVAGCWMAITPGNGILNVAPNMNINVVAKLFLFSLSLLLVLLVLLVLVMVMVMLLLVATTSIHSLLERRERRRRYFHRRVRSLFV